MDRGIQIARLFGIKIRIDWSWLLIFLLISWNLTSVFAQIQPDWSLVFSIVMGVSASLLFFLSVLAHELGHSLVAQSQGIPVDSIMLFLFGGIANIREEPKSPGAEFIMAVMGPVVSILLGLALILLGGIGLELDTFQATQPMQILEGLGPLRTLAMWLGSVNVLLGVFNMIPGFPLDGGRVLRSIFWAITDNLRKATRWASFVGQGVAWVMIVSGISMIFGIQIPFFGEGFIGGLWLILIGWFLNNAASRSYQQIIIRDVLENVPVRKMTKQNPPTVPSNITVDALVEDYIMQTDDHAFPVMDDDRLVGIVCLDDVRKVKGPDRSTLYVSEIMTPRDELKTISPDDDAHNALTTISKNAIRQLIVMEGDQVFGMVRRRDIVRFLQLQSDDFMSITGGL